MAKKVNQIKEFSELINYDLLHELIRGSNKTFTEIAKECGISRDALYTKVNGDREFKLLEYVRLCFTLGISLTLLLRIMETEN